MEPWRVAAESLSYQLNQVLNLCDTLESEIGVTGIKERFREQFFRDLSRLAAHCSCIDGFRHENEDKLFLEQMLLLEENPQRREEMLRFFHKEISDLMNGVKKANAQEIQFPSVLIAHTLEKLCNRELAYGLSHQLSLFAQNMSQADGHVSSSESDFLDCIQGNLLLALTIHWGQYKEEIEKIHGKHPFDFEGIDDFPDLLEPQRVVRAKGVKKEINFNGNVMDSCLRETEEFVGPIGLTQLIQKLTQPKFLTTNGTLLEKVFSSKGLHLCFSGKDLKQKKVATRLLARVLSQLGYLTKSHVRETSQEEWLDSYYSTKVHGLNEVFDEAEGGLLLIHDLEEVIELEKGPDLRREIQEILQHKVLDFASNTVVVFFLQENDEAMLSALPELKPISIHFPAINSTGLAKLFLKKVQEQGFLIDENTRSKIAEILHSKLSESSYQAIDRFFVSVLEKQAHRLLSTNDLDAQSYRTLTFDDIEGAD